MTDIAVLLSIHPKYCQLIANGEKTIEIRKTRPKIDPPFKCYIYCTKEHNTDDTIWIFGKKARDLFLATVDIAHLCGAKDVGGAYKGNGKVVGEFVCDEICKVNICGWWDKNGNQKDGVLEKSCLTSFQLCDYLEEGIGYAWHISDLKIYDRPKELSEFRKCGADSIDGLEDGLCKYCKDTMRGEMATYGTPNGPVMCEGRFCGKAYETYLDEEFSLTRPPQSWCYAEERR